LSTVEKSRVADVRAALATFVDGRPSALSWLPEALRDATGADKSMCASYAPRGHGLTATTFVHRVAPGLPAFFDEWLADKTVGWTAYNPLRPEPAQRNRVWTLADVRSALNNGELAEVPIVNAVYRRFGLEKDEHLRVLVCEGASLLAYAALLQAAPFETRQRRILLRLVGPIRRRLSAERLLSGGTATRALLEAALEEIPAAAFVIGNGGAVLDCNSLGRAWLATDKRGRTEALRATTQGKRRGARDVRVTAILDPAGASRFLVVRKADDRLRHACLLAVARWRLSRREADVLGLLVEGLTNRTIAAQLGVGERAVELHMTALFEKAQVESRAELLVRVLDI
jgi:DNA-binding CsgD family transcriptional regulator